MVVRIKHLNAPSQCSGFDLNIQKELKKYGHKIGDQKGLFGGYQAIMLKDGIYYGASESRKDGQAAGY